MDRQWKELGDPNARLSFQSASTGMNSCANGNVVLGGPMGSSPVPNTAGTPDDDMSRASIGNSAAPPGAVPGYPPNPYAPPPGGVPPGGVPGYPPPHPHAPPPYGYGGYPPHNPHAPPHYRPYYPPPPPPPQPHRMSAAPSPYGAPPPPDMSGKVNSLTDERIKKLTNMGFNWEFKRRQYFPVLKT